MKPPGDEFSGDEADLRREVLSEDRRRLFELLAEKRRAEAASRWGPAPPSPSTSQSTPPGEASGAEPSARADAGAPREPGSPRLVRMKRGGPKEPFFCVHALLGSVFPYQRLALHMPDDRPFYGVEARGIDGKEAPLEDVSAMAASYLDAIETVAPRGPLHLGGYSFGAFIAYEMARQARLRGRELGVLAIFGAGAPLSAAIPGWDQHVRFALQYMEDLQKLVRNAYLAEKGPEAPPFPDPFAAEANLPPMQRVTLANGRAQMKYVPEPLEAAMDLFVTAEQKLLFQIEPTLGWKALVSGEIRTHSIGGNHLSIFEEPQVEGLSGILAKCLDEHRSRP